MSYNSHDQERRIKGSSPLLEIAARVSHNPTFPQCHIFPPTVCLAMKQAFFSFSFKSCPPPPSESTGVWFFSPLYGLMGLGSAASSLECTSAPRSSTHPFFFCPQKRDEFCSIRPHFLRVHQIRFLSFRTIRIRCSLGLCAIPIFNRRCFCRLEPLIPFRYAFAFLLVLQRSLLRGCGEK